jgi:putative FmdB family regulatory protein
MPTYDYKCSACGHTFEQFQSITAPPIKRCPQCGKAKVKRLIGTGAGLIFKGSGFYITDYRDAGYKEKAKAESGGDSKAETKTDGKAETKSGGDSGSSAPATSGSDSKPAQPKPDTKSSSKSEGKSSRKKQ